MIYQSISTTLIAVTCFGLPMFTQCSSTNADNIVVNSAADELERLLAGKTGLRAVVVASRAVAAATTAVVTSSTTNLAISWARINALNAVGDTRGLGCLRDDTHVGELSVVRAAHWIKADKV